MREKPVNIDQEAITHPYSLFLNNRIENVAKASELAACDDTKLYPPSRQSCTMQSSPSSDGSCVGRSLSTSGFISPDESWSESVINTAIARNTTHDSLR